MRFLVTISMAALVVGWGCGAESGEPSALSSEDFVVAGVGEESDTGEVREVVGEADSVVTYEHPFDVSGGIPTHYYRDLIISYGDSGTPTGFMMTGPAVETARGLKVGDTVRRVKELYGEPVYADDRVLQYADPGKPSGLHVIQVEISDSVVQRIFAGWLLD